MRFRPNSKCTFTTFETFRDKIANKKQQPIPNKLSFIFKQNQLYLCGNEIGQKIIEKSLLEKVLYKSNKQKWQEYSEKIFRSFVEGKAMKLFRLMKKSKLPNIHSVQELRSQIDKLIQSISQGQEHMFSKSMLTKKLALKNLQQEQVCQKLKRYKENEAIDIKLTITYKNCFLQNRNNQRVRKFEVNSAGECHNNFN